MSNPMHLASASKALEAYDQGAHNYHARQRFELNRFERIWLRTLLALLCLALVSLVAGLGFRSMPVVVTMSHLAVLVLGLAVWKSLPKDPPVPDALRF